MTTPQSEPKKSSCLAIGGAGCLALLILIVAGAGAAWWKFGPQAKEWIVEFQQNPERAGAMIILKVNPDIEILKVDDAKKTVTFKIKSSNEIITATFAAVSKSRITYINGKTEINGLERAPSDDTVIPPPPAPPAPKAP